MFTSSQQAVLEFSPTRRRTSFQSLYVCSIFYNFLRIFRRSQTFLCRPSECFMTSVFDSTPNFHYCRRIRYGDAEFASEPFERHLHRSQFVKESKKVACLLLLCVSNLQIHIHAVNVEFIDQCDRSRSTAIRQSKDRLSDSSSR